MQTTVNYGLKKPEGTDVIDVQNFNDNADIIDTKLKEYSTALADLIYPTAGGTATALTLTLPTLTSGYAKTFIASANNSGSATTINGKPLYKPGTTSAPTLISGKAYTVWYNSTSSCFFIKASAEGNAVVSNVLAGTTFSNDTDTGLIGTMVNNGAVSITPGTTAKTIAQGYHNGSGTIAGDSNLVTGNIKSGVTIFGISGKSSVVETSEGTATAGQMLSGSTAYVNGSKITGTISSKTAQTYTPGTSVQAITSGQYLSGVQTISGDTNLVSSNIKSGISIFGVSGNSNVVDTSDAVLDPAYLVSGYSGYDDGVKKAGTLANMTSATTFGGADSGDFYNSAGICGGTAYNSYVGAFDIYVPRGYYSGSETNRLHIPNLLPQYIRSGINVGWNGNYISGTAQCTEIVTGTTTIQGTTGNECYITVSLPWVPDIMAAKDINSRMPMAFNYGGISNAVGYTSSGNYKPENVPTATKFYMGNNVISGISVNYIAIKFV